MQSHLVTLVYEGHNVTYRSDGWFNATEAAAHYDKEPFDWLRQRETVEYIVALYGRKSIPGFLPELNEINSLDGTSAKSRRRLIDLAKRTGLVSTKSGAPETGGGTWLHPKLAVVFARWLSVDFAVWCDEQIDKLIHSKHDWATQRHAATAGAKLLAMTLQVSRERQGKMTLGHHYSNEHLMLNKLVTGERKGCDRDAADSLTLDALAKLQIQDSMMMLDNVDYHGRQEALQVSVLALAHYRLLPVANMIAPALAKKLRTGKAANDPKLDS